MGWSLTSAAVGVSSLTAAGERGSEPAVLDRGIGTGGSTVPSASTSSTSGLATGVAGLDTSVSAASFELISTLLLSAGTGGRFTSGGVFNGCDKGLEEGGCGLGGFGLGG